MGIDIYAKWKNISEKEEKSQYTGFSVNSGDVGYLREAYHGGPYVTKFLVQEAFEQGEAKIPAKLLRERLPSAVLMALYRNKQVYEKGKNIGNLNDLSDLGKALTKVFAIETKDDTHESFVRELKPANILQAEMLIENKQLPNFAQAFVDFVVLCENKEKETGEPCEIIASY